jgi:putative RecB family exonuclease
MAVYSNSKLKTFEQCPLQFRFRYLDRVPTDIESVEAFTGKRAHESLEWLYQESGAGRVPPLAALIADYEQRWHRQWHRLVQIAKRDTPPEAYLRRGRRCIENYYRGNWPFDADHTLDLEAKISFALDEEILVIGYIDRVARGEAGELLIHDYKTGSYMPRRHELLGDLQLAIYQMGATERWPWAEDVRLVWHFLTFGRKVTVQLGGAIADKRQELARRVAAVEQAVAAGEEWPARTSKLCDWCSYRAICPAQGGDPERASTLALSPAERAGAGVATSSVTNQLKLI